jgi:superfamily II DNA or RNA helicase
MAEFDVGLYETIVTERLRAALTTDSERHFRTRPLESGDSADRIARHIGSLVQQALMNIPEDQRVTRGVALANELVSIILNSERDVLDDSIIEPSEILKSVSKMTLAGMPFEYMDPLVPLLDTALLTNAPGEPVLWRQLLAEIDSADEIDVVMAFIRRSGIKPLLGALQRHCDSGKPLRVLTTTYTNSTEGIALDQLLELGAQIRISYDLTSTRLHAKAWCFRRHSGFSTAYVGSSNLTFSAQVTGLEWNIRASGIRNPDIISKFDAVFESYWQGNDFVQFNRQQFEEEASRNRNSSSEQMLILPGLELRPEPFQERLLELISLAREQGHHRNLLVAATGTGKTVIAAVDYARLRNNLPRARLLFVAHREEILDQSMATFRYALRNVAFGEKWVGTSRPKDFEHVFASIQMLQSTDLSNLPPDHFDVVIVDEFHHAAARSYVRLLNHLQPTELLGLTATPERSDGLSIFHWFDNRIAAELRLWDAIDQGRLVPFIYYGIHDELDLTLIPWKRGTGYDIDALSKIYTSTDSWARLVVKQVEEHVENISTMRCLGFCVSVEHAQFMSRHFNAYGIPSVAVWGGSTELERHKALSELADGSIRAVFSVDLFNEGIDVPSVDTILLLRPTESPTLFMQQLGRGLRRSAGKTVCTVMDFVGTHRKEFRYDRRFLALLGGTRKDIERAVKSGFPYLPAGCFMQLDRKSAEVVLKSLRSALPSRWKDKVSELRSMATAIESISLNRFLQETGLELDDLYDGQAGHCWSSLCEEANVPILAAGPHENQLRRAIGRMLHIDDSERISYYIQLLLKVEPPNPMLLSVREGRLLRMLVNSITGGTLPRDATLAEGVNVLWDHPQVKAELVELLAELSLRKSHINLELSDHLDIPLQVHARYTRREILAAMGEGDENLVVLPEWREGVRSAKLERTELLAFTLDKNDASFSPTTRYRDYAISPTRIHWESQSVTAAGSPTGMRYRNHQIEDRSIFLFSRLRKDDRSFWFLGPAIFCGYVGEKPMAITWELTFPLAADLFTEFAAAVA